VSATPTVSIITPAYNASAFLSQTVASALAQTWQDFELLIVDDGSTDDTQEVARAWERADSRVSVLTRPHGGPSAARNTAIAHGRGSHYALLDSDDLWHPTFLGSQMEIFAGHRNIDVVTGNAYNLGGPQDGQPVNPAGTACRELSLLNILERENSVFIMSVFRRAVIERIVGFDETLPLNEDYDFWIRAAHAGFTFIHNPVPLGHYRRRPDSISANEIQMVTGIMHVFRQAGELCADRPRELAAIRKQLARFEEERLLASAKANLVHWNFAAAAVDFNSLFDVRRDFSSAVIARMSRYAPGILLWAYRMKCAMRGRARLAVAPSPMPSAAIHASAAASPGIPQEIAMFSSVPAHATPPAPLELRYDRGLTLEADRFAFGRNWLRFLTVLDQERILRAETSLLTMLKESTLEGRRFLDIGSGSGLFSLAARRLGATVHSFDLDPESVHCALELRRRYFPGDVRWRIEQGSALDRDYLASLGKFDVVYSWGVLHHTGRMYEALENAALPVASSGKLFVAIYNDLGSRTARWRLIKRTYNRLPRLMRPAFTALAAAPNEARAFAGACLKGEALGYLRSWTAVGERGMSRWRDVVDWVGGYPYEAATPEQIFHFYDVRGFKLVTLKCGGVGLGCNEFVFVRDNP
jgi:glycosyltransferase involved in cell wall biosynthesis/2-polyprenyl-3-methyl-5-hydroxy-6-metoxy-1,4-benzoquinol methylase